MKPTPAPWSWSYGDVGVDYSVPYCSVTVEDGDLTIAEVNDLFDKEIGHANARLIVAACNAFQTAAERLGCDPVKLAERFADGGLWDLEDSIDPDTLEAIADEINCFEHSARAASLRSLAKLQRTALALFREDK